MIFCKELNKEFESKKAMFKALSTSKDAIIAAKKAEIIKSCDKGLSVNAKPISINKLQETNKALSIDEDYYYLAVNTTRILDSHTDLHINGIWNGTVKEQQGKVYLIMDHDLELNKVVAKKEHIEMLVAEIPFSMVGKDYPGNTQALIYKVRKDKIINEAAKNWLDSGDSIELSVRMRYVDIEFALNSEAEEDKAYKKNYLKYINEIVNKEDFVNEIDYFWVVKQAQNVHESSLVLFGSNNATGQITVQQKESGNRSEESNNNARKGLDFGYMVKNFDKHVEIKG